MDERGIYRLVSEDRNHEKKYLDFSGKRVFMVPEYSVRYSVPLSEIDAYTAGKMSVNDLLNSADSSSYDSAKKVYISYNYSGEKKLDCIYNDDVLQKIALKTIGDRKGSINLSDNNTKVILVKMFMEITNRNSNLTDDILSRHSNSYSVNAHNKDLIADLHSDYAYTEKKRNYQLYRFFRAFSSYKEFRALYFNYKEYMNKLNKPLSETNERTNEKVKSLVKKRVNAPVPGQISMFEILKNN